jgi:hypothetical protein
MNFNWFDLLMLLAMIVTGSVTGAALMGAF